MAARRAATAVPDRTGQRERPNRARGGRRLGHDRQRKAVDPDSAARTGGSGDEETHRADLGRCENGARGDGRGAKGHGRRQKIGPRRNERSSRMTESPRHRIRRQRTVAAVLQRKLAVQLQTGSDRGPRGGGGELRGPWRVGEIRAFAETARTSAACFPARVCARARAAAEHRVSHPRLPHPTPGTSPPATTAIGEWQRASVYPIAPVAARSRLSQTFAADFIRVRM